MKMKGKKPSMREDLEESNENPAEEASESPAEESSEGETADSVKLGTNLPGMGPKRVSRHSVKVGKAKKSAGLANVKD